MGGKLETAPSAPVAATGRYTAVEPVTAAGVEIGQTVRVAGKRGCYRVVGFRPGGVQLMDDDQKWHVVRPEAVRAMPAPAGPGRANRPR